MKYEVIDNFLDEDYFNDLEIFFTNENLSVEPDSLLPWFFQPDIGTDLRGSLFENFHPTLETVIEDQIRETITNHEPRVDNINVQLDPYIDSNGFEVTVLFDIVGLDIPTQQFSFLLEPTR